MPSDNPHPTDEELVERARRGDDAAFEELVGRHQRRIYAVDSGALKDVDAWLSRFRRFWDVRLEALDLEVRRGKKQRAKRR